MSTVLENTLVCSYKGAQIYVDRISSTSGRSKANYLYLNTGRRVSKDLGALPKTFRVEGFTYAQDGDEYEAMRDALRSVLDSPLDGDFVHPRIKETFWCAHSTYTWDEDFGDVNVCRFSFVLQQVSKGGANPLTPTGELFNKSQIKDLALAANRELQTACADAFNVSTPINRASAISFIQSIADKLRGTFSSIGETISKANDYVDLALDIYEQAEYYANNPHALFAAIADGIIGVDGLTNEIYAKFRTIQNMFDYGDDGSDTSFAITSPTVVFDEPSTFEDAERTNNAKQVKNFAQAGALIQAFSTAGASDPETTEEIDEFTEVLEEQFRKTSTLLTDDDAGITTNLGAGQPDYGESNKKIAELRTAVYRYLSQKRANAAYVTTINVQPMPCSTLAYLLYEDSSRMDEIMRLNDLTDPFEVSGELRVLSK